MLTVLRKLRNDFELAQRIHANARLGMGIILAKGKCPEPSLTQLAAIHLFDSRISRVFPAMAIRPPGVTDVQQVIFGRVYVLAATQDAIQTLWTLAERGGQTLAGAIQDTRIPNDIALIGQWITATVIYFHLMEQTPLFTQTGNLIRGAVPFEAGRQMAERLIAQVQAGERTEAAAVQPVSSKGKQGKVKRDKKELGVQAWRYLEENPRMTIKQLAAKLDCSVGTAQKLPAWAEKMQKEKAGRVKVPKAVSFTEKLEKVTGREDANLDEATLNELIRDQEKDFEPSPLEQTERIVRARKRV